MLGFDALGRLALGQLSDQSASTAVLEADAGSYVISGNATGGGSSLLAAPGSYLVVGNGGSFSSRLISDPGAYTIAGDAVGFAITAQLQAGAYSYTGSVAAGVSDLAADSGSYLLAGGSEQFRTDFVALSGSYAIGPAPTAFQVSWPVTSGAYTVTLGEFELRRYGGDYEPGYAGIGHYLEEQVRLRKLAKIVRKTPRPVVSAVPALPQITSVPDVRRIEAGILNGAHVLQDNQPNTAAIRKQAQRRAALALLLAA